MQIRRAAEKDIACILRLLGQVADIHHSIRPDLFKENAVKYDSGQLSVIIRNDSTPVFVYENDDGSILGYIFCIAEETKETDLRTGIRTLYIDDLCVDGSSRRQHVGRALYEHVRSYAKEKGFYNVTLHVWGGNSAALAFYRRMGMTDQFICMEEIL